MVHLWAYILAIFLLVLGHDGVVETAPLPGEPESLASRLNDPLSIDVGNTKVRVLAPAQSPAIESVATRRQLIVSPTKKPTRKPTRMPVIKTKIMPSNAPSFEPTSFTIPPTQLFPVLPIPPSQASVPTFPIKPPSLPFPFTHSPVAKPTSPSGPLARLIQRLRSILGISNDPPSLAPVGAPTPAGKIVDLQLVKAVSGAFVTRLANFSVVYLNGTTPSYTIAAITTGGPIQSVQFTWNSPTVYRTETIAPYTLCGGRFYSQCVNLQAGAHTVTATVNGKIETTYRVSFSIVNGVQMPKPMRRPTKRPTRRPTRKPTPNPGPSSSPTWDFSRTLPPKLSCPRADDICPGENLMQKKCVTQCVEEPNVKRKRRAGWHCGRCSVNYAK
jgi:hypothetical protein